ncbi:MAG: peptidase S41, partial [bacterium]|nr:peptidase S41 [bacterium]
MLTASIPLFSTSGIDIKDTRMLEQPAISQSHIAFVYAGDLWAADIDGRNARQLTSHEGEETNPVFSPDGKQIAFSAHYDGNTDVYIVAAAGGVPKRLTWHPGKDTARGFTPDGSAVLFISPRNVFTRRYQQLFTVPVTGGLPTQLEIPNAFKAAYSADGTRMAYTPISEPFRQWKHYRGGRNSRIWIYKFNDHSVEQVPQPEGRCNDTDPMWVNGSVYFISDRNGEFNLFSFKPAAKELKQLTQHTDYPVLSASAGNGKVIYEQAGYLHIFDPAVGSAVKLTVGAAADLKEVRPRYAHGDENKFIRDTSISPSGARAAFEFRGEIVTLPAKKGDPRNLTNTPGAHERSPAWSPDGSAIAYFSDASGEYKLTIQSQDGKKIVRTLSVKGNGFYSAPVWSPDSLKISYIDNSHSIYWLDLVTGVSKKIASDFYFRPGPFPETRAGWSPDSRWIAYTANNAAYLRQVFIYSLEQNKSYAVTDSLIHSEEPIFDKSGKYLYFLASTNAGPTMNWFAQSRVDARMTFSIYVIVLPKGVTSPLAKESDEEGKEKPEDKKSNKNAGKTVKPVTIDFDGLSNRVLALPLPAANYINLQAGNEGEIYFLELPPVRGIRGAASKLHKFDFKKKKDSVLLTRVDDYSISSDRKNILFQSGKSWEITKISEKITPGKNRLKTSAVTVPVNPLMEWRQIFDEAWRINRDFFYDPGM